MTVVKIIEQTSRAHKKELEFLDAIKARCTFIYRFTAKKDYQKTMKRHQYRDVNINPRVYILAHLNSFLFNSI